MNALPDARSLALFVRLAEEMHFGRAAERLGMAQPALSQQIARLERAVGFRLFDRTSRRVTLTPAGAAFLQAARRVVATLRDGVEEGRLVAAGALGRVVVGYTATAMLTVLPRIVRRFRAEHPRVRVALREMSSAPQLEALAAGSLDVALVGDLLLLGREDAVAFWPDRLVLAMPAEHPAAMRRHVSPGARPSVNGSPLVLFPREQSPGLFDAILALCARLGLEPEVTQHAQSWHMILALVGAGLGVSVVPAAVRRLRVPGVRFVDIGPSPTEVGVTLCVRGGAAPTAAAFAAVGRTVDWP